MKDFTLSIYKQLLTEFQKADYSFLTFEQYCNAKKLPERFIILRHDVDRKPENALKIAKIESEMEIKASYYFRIVKESYNENIIRQIVKLGDEIGYHYEDLALAKGNYELGITNFELNLKKLRKFYAIKTICMHGSPLSKWDNRLIWQKYNYKDFGIIGEPYFDIDFNKVLYLTDTGRRWNGANVSIRDKVESQYKYSFRSTFDIITALERNELPERIMINTHPHRWNNSSLQWAKELVWQNIKNIVKQFFVKK